MAEIVKVDPVTGEKIPDANQDSNNSNGADGTGTGTQSTSDGEKEETPNTQASGNDNGDGNGKGTGDVQFTDLSDLSNFFSAIDKIEETKVIGEFPANFTELMFMHLRYRPDKAKYTAKAVNTVLEFVSALNHLVGKPGYDTIVVFKDGFVTQQLTDFINKELGPFSEFVYPTKVTILSDDVSQKNLRKGVPRNYIKLAYSQGEMGHLVKSIINGFSDAWYRSGSYTEYVKLESLVISREHDCSRVTTKAWPISEAFLIVQATELYDFDVEADNVEQKKREFIEDWIQNLKKEKTD